MFVLLKLEPCLYYFSTRIATVPLRPEVFNSPTEQNADYTLYNFQCAAASSAW